MHPKSNPHVANIIGRANRIASEYELEYVGTEHLLLALQKEGKCAGAKLMAEKGVTTKSLRDEIDRLAKKQLEETWVFGRLPGTPHFKNVMAVAIDESKKLDASELCSEHLLLALLKEKGSVASDALKNLGLTYQVVRQELLRRKPKPQS